MKPLIIAAPNLNSAKLFGDHLTILMHVRPVYVTEPERLRALGPETILFLVLDVSAEWNDRVTPYLHQTRARVLSGSLDQFNGVIRGDAVARGDMVTVSRTAWEQYQKDSDKLCALEAAGVDNWEGYGTAMATLREDDEE